MEKNIVQFECMGGTTKEIENLVSETPLKNLWLISYQYFGFFEMKVFPLVVNIGEGWYSNRPIECYCCIDKRYSYYF